MFKNNNLLSRREFLKFSLFLSLAQLTSGIKLSEDSEKPNFLILVFDAWTARNNSLYGYPRETTPNLTRLANRAVVYHQHYAGSNWTVPGTASLLTGSYPWSHRSFTNMEFRVVKSAKEKNIFKLLHEYGYYTNGFSANPYAHQFLHQFRADVDLITPIRDLFLDENPPFPPTIFENDPDPAWMAYHQIFTDNQNISPSLLLGGVLKDWYREISDRIQLSLKEDYPKGGNTLASPHYYRLNENIDLSIELVKAFPRPFLAYHHFFPPHSPYRPPKGFFGKFEDGWSPVIKPESLFTEGYTQEQLLARRKHYDEFVAHVDSEIGRLMDVLEAENQLDNTWVIITSDHGELFERGMVGHDITVGYDGLIRVPLIIFPPGQTNRVDIYENTSAVDILPTLLHLSGQKTPTGLEGVVLPPFGPTRDPEERSVFVFGPEYAPQFEPIRKGGAILIKGQYKLVYLFGLPQIQDVSPMIELFDLENDPEELSNLYPDEQKELGDEMLEELLAELAKADAPYRGN